MAPPMDCHTPPQPRRQHDPEHQGPPPANRRRRQEDPPAFQGRLDFGTFQYDKDVSDPSPWMRLTPVTLMWGDDPAPYKDSDFENGTTPAESWVNAAAPVVNYRANPPAGRCLRRPVP